MTRSTPNRPSSGLPAFSILWTGQTVSAIGSALTSFALGVWVYQKYGSVTQFSIIFLLNALPRIFLAPLAGALVDRWNRRTAMLLSDTGAALGTLMIAVLLWNGHLEVWHVYVTTTLGSIFSTLQWLAYMAASTQMVAKDSLGRSNGMIQISLALSQLVSPAAAGFLLGEIQLRGILLIDFATFLASLVSLALVRVPTLPSAETRQRPSVLRDALYGLGYLKARPGLLWLMGFFGITNMSMGFLQTLMTPLVLTFATTRELGVIVSFSGLGMLAGSLTMAAWGGPRRMVRAVLTVTVIHGIVLLLAGLRPSALLITVAGFLFLFFDPVLLGCGQTLWQRKVAQEAQGRVFAIRQMVGWSSMSLAYLMAGPLADRLFEPLMVSGGTLAGTVGRFIGVGPGRGTALLIVLLGVVNIAAGLGGALYPRLRNLETEIPDAVAPTPAAAAAPAP